MNFKLILLLLFPIISFSQIIVNNTFHTRKIIFEGNSLSCETQDGTITGGNYIPISTYNALKGSSNLSLTTLAVSARTQAMINASQSTLVLPFVYQNDIIVLWEGTNDMGIGGLNATQAWSNVVTYINGLLGKNVKLVICTVIARDAVGDRAGLMDTEIPSYNTLIKDSAATYGYTVCDLAENINFDSRADASNTTYYNADKLHLKQAGQDLIITIITNIIITIL